MLSWSKRQLQFSFTPAQRAGVSERCWKEEKHSTCPPLSQNIFEENLLPWELLWGLSVIVQEFIMKMRLRSKGRLGVFLIERGLCKSGFIQDNTHWAARRRYLQTPVCIYSCLCPQASTELSLSLGGTWESGGEMRWMSGLEHFKKSPVRYH